MFAPAEPDVLVELFVLLVVYLGAIEASLDPVDVVVRQVNVESSVLLLVVDQVGLVALGIATVHGVPYFEEAVGLLFAVFDGRHDVRDGPDGRDVFLLPMSLSSHL